MRAVSDPSIQDKSRLQMKVNFPEVSAIIAVIASLCQFPPYHLHCALHCTQVNPAFDTYRIGTLLEMVRTIALRLAEQRGLRVRVCVQQSLGEGVVVEAIILMPCSR